jgi:hypothetical protein
VGFLAFWKHRIAFTQERAVETGVTRKTIFDIAAEENIELLGSRVPLKLAYKADQIFCCTTADGIMRSPLWTQNQSAAKTVRSDNLIGDRNLSIPQENHDVSSSDIA